MNTVYKYPLGILDTGDLREIEMPQGARILGVQVVKAMGGYLGVLEVETPCIWALVNTEEGKTVRRMFRVYGTGRPIKEPLESLTYIGTVQTGPFVWHVFERKISK